MGVIIVDIFCALLVVGGIVLAIRGAGAVSDQQAGAPRPAAYASRIAGVMMAAFGIALGMIVTVFSIASG